MTRRGDSHRVMRWLWTSRRPDARLARLALLPVSGLWRGAVAARGLAYRRGWLPVHDLPLPAVAVGNLTVGGSGKTPIAIWIARYYVGRGLRPGILLRGYGGDETLVHRHDVPEAVVVANPDRAVGAARGDGGGAEVLVLDDAYQRLDVRRDLNIAVVSAETTRAVRWPLPAGPWREGWSALERADALIVTRKRATADAAAKLAAELATRTASTGGGCAPGTSSPRRTRVGHQATRRVAGRQARGGRVGASPIPMPSWPRPRRPERRSRWRPGRIITTIATRTSPGWPTRRGGPTSW